MRSADPEERLRRELASLLAGVDGVTYKVERTGHWIDRVFPDGHKRHFRVQTLRPEDHDEYAFDCYLLMGLNPDWRDMGGMEHTKRQLRRVILEDIPLPDEVRCPELSAHIDTSQQLQRAIQGSKIYKKVLAHVRARVAGVPEVKLYEQDRPGRITLLQENRCVEIDVPLDASDHHFKVCYSLEVPGKPDKSWRNPTLLRLEDILALIDRFLLQKKP